MTFQAYLDNIESKTGLTPRQFLSLAAEKGFGAGSKSTPIVEWLAADFGLGTTHRDPSNTLWLDGRASKPAP